MDISITKLNKDLPRRLSRKPSYASNNSQASSSNSNLPRISGCSTSAGMSTPRSNVFDRLHPSPLTTSVATPSAYPGHAPSKRVRPARLVHQPSIRGGEDVSVVEFQRSVLKCQHWLSSLPDRFYGLESTLFERALRNTSMTYDAGMMEDSAEFDLQVDARRVNSTQEMYYQSYA